MKLAKLYKKNLRGSIQEWSIDVDGTSIVTRYGLRGGKTQETRDTIKSGKNLGKINETSIEEQAEAEALAKWVKQKERGYSESLDSAKSQTSFGAIDVMLAHTYSKHGHKIVYPAYVQPKLDGIRCVALIEDGHVSLWTRSKKRITSMIHIEEALSGHYGKGRHILDGELYNHEFKDKFEKIVSHVRKEEPEGSYTDVQYHIYDLAHTDSSFESRYSQLVKEDYESTYLVKVPTKFVSSENDTFTWFEEFKSNGYEGAIIRNAEGMYVGNRSYDLQKIKDFDDAEFVIISANEGRGKLAGHVASFTCITDDGTPFDVKLMGDQEFLKRAYENPSTWEGKSITVKFQGYTNKNGVPRFPVGVRINNPV